MSDIRQRAFTSPGRRAAALGAALGAVLLLVGGGMFFGQEAPASNATGTPLVGRTTTVCTTSVAQKGAPAEQTEVLAVAVHEAPDRSGLLTGSTLSSKPTELKITQLGKGAHLSRVTSPIVVSAEGAMATAGSSVIVSDVMEGPGASLSAAPCLGPATLHWFSGLGATDDDRTDLILTNPDDAQAQVDLRYYGQSGRIAVPASSGRGIKGHQSVQVSLNGLVPADGPFSVQVQATEGRVTAVAKRSQGVADWQIPSASPSPIIVIPGIPSDAGRRQLVVTNPGNSRATVGVQVLGFQGPYEPSGAESLEVAPESTATVSLEKGLGGAAGSIKLTSNVPVTGAVISTSQRRGAATDLAIQSAAVPLIGSGVSALATSTSAESELIVSNAGDADAQITFQVINYDGVTLRTGEMLLGANSTATRRLNSPAPYSYVVVKVPDGSSVLGGVVLTQPDRREVSGLATIPFSSPDLASRAPATRPDYSVGH
jgi:hypothetical protein